MTLYTEASQVSIDLCFKGKYQFWFDMEKFHCSQRASQQLASRWHWSERFSSPISGARQMTAQIVTFQFRCCPKTGATSFTVLAHHPGPAKDRHASIPKTFIVCEDFSKNIRISLESRRHPSSSITPFITCTCCIKPSNDSQSSMIPLVRERDCSILACQCFSTTRSHV